MTSSDLLIAVATVAVIAVAVYSYGMAFAGRISRRAQASGTQRLFFGVLVPCLNEAAVIGRTLESLLSLRGRFHIIVLDDASDDASAAVLRRFPPHMVTVVQRTGADSRVGKGAALNNGYREILDSNVARLYGEENVIVTVFDSDSNVPPDFIEQVSPYFGNPAVVGVQSEVRMYNAARNSLTFWQNLEFAAWGQLFSRGKDRLGSATLGGNGQCVRLSSLRELGSTPWRPSLTEDLDLSLRLIERGGRIRFTDATYVAQEAVAGIRQLVRQRSRWVQGHLVAWEHLGPICRSGIPLRVRVDLSIFLLLPAALAPIAFATVHGWQMFIGSLGAQSLAALLGWYLFGFACAPLVVSVLVRSGLSFPRAILQAHLFVLYGFLWVVAAGRAGWSILRGDRSWAKTSRAPTSMPAKRRWLSPQLARQGIAAVLLVTVVASTTVLMATAANSTFDTIEQVSGEGAHETVSRTAGEQLLVSR